MTYAELIDVAAAEARTTKELAREVLAAAHRAIARAAVEHGERTWVPGFGTFTRRTRKARRIHNPQTNEPMELPAAVALGFRASKDWRGPAKKKNPPRRAR